MYQLVSGTLDLSLQPELFIMNTKKLYLQCRTSLGAITIVLPSITTLGVPNTWGFELYINDIDDNASVNNITIVPFGTNKINGVNSPVVFGYNGQTGSCFVTGDSSWCITTNQANEGLLFSSLHIPAAAVLTLKSVPLVIVPAVPLKKIITISAWATINNQDKSPYSGGLDLWLITEDADIPQIDFAGKASPDLGFLSSTITRTLLGYQVTNGGLKPGGNSVWSPTNTTAQIVAGSALFVFVPLADPTGGDSSLDITVAYVLKS